MTVGRSKARPPCAVSGLLTWVNMVGDTGIEPVTSTVSKRSYRSCADLWFYKTPHVSAVR
jgi:hypothetical protein